MRLGLGCRDCYVIGGRGWLRKQIYTLSIFEQIPGLLMIDDIDFSLMSSTPRSAESQSRHWSLTAEGHSMDL